MALGYGIRWAAKAKNHEHEGDEEYRRRARTKEHPEQQDSHNGATA